MTIIQESLTTCQDYDKALKNKCQAIKKIENKLREIIKEKSFLINRMKEILRHCQVIFGFYNEH